MAVVATLMTPPAPGAVAVLQLDAAEPAELAATLAGVTGRPAGALEVGRVRLADLAGIDRGLVAVVSPRVAQLMPHGGPGVLRQLMAALAEQGVATAPPTASPPSRALYPEAGSDLEADVLAAMAQAASSGAIDVLAGQIAAWRSAAEQDVALAGPAGRDARDHLLRAPVVVVVGRPNVGKSTLANALAGRSVSIVADLPGTTRDWVGSVIEIGGVAVQWLDTPGLRFSDDAIEQSAITAAREAVASADVLVAMRDPGSDWPQRADLPRDADVRVLGKIDLGGAAAEPDVVAISAAADRGLDTLQRRVLEALGLERIDAAAPWRFSAALRRPMDPAALRRYVGLGG